MSTQTSRKKYALHPTKKAKASRTITAKRNGHAQRNSLNYDLNDEEFILRNTEDGGVLGSLPFDHHLTRQLDSIQQREIRGGKKKSSYRSRQQQKNKEVNPLEVAQIRQGQSTRPRHSHGASLEVEQVPINSTPGWIVPEKVRASSDSCHKLPLKPRLDSTRPSGAHHSNSRHLQSEKPHSKVQVLRNGFTNLTSSITTSLKKKFSPSIKSSSSALSSSKRNRGAAMSPIRKAEEVVDLCNDDDDGGQFDHDESDGESTTTERSPEVPSSTEVPHSTHRSEVTSRGSTSSSCSEVSSNSPSTSAKNGETSSASVVASAAAATAMKNSQDSTLSSEDMERLTASTEGPSRAQGRFALKDTDDLIPGDSLSLEEVRDNVCYTLEDISNEPYTASRLSTTSTYLSRSDDSDLVPSQKKARTQSTSRKDPPKLNVNLGASALPKKPTTSEGTGLGSLTKANVKHKRKNGKGVPIVIGASIQQNCPTNEDPIEYFSDHEEAGTRRQSKRPRKRALQLSKGISPTTFYGKSEPNSTRQKRPRQCKQDKLVMDLSSDEHADHSYSSDNNYTFDNESWPVADLGRARSFRVGDVAGRKVVTKEMDAVRIAIGKKVFSTRCKLKFISLSNGKGCLILTYDKGLNSTRVDHKINLDCDSVKEMKYYLADEEDNPLGTIVAVDFDESEELSFLAMKVEPTKDNGLKKFTNAYVPNGDDSKVNKRYIAIEFRSNSDFRDFLNVMRKDEFLNAFVTEESKLTAAHADEYGRTLLEEARKERQNREKSMGSPRLRRTRKSRTGAKVSNKVMVVFPFGADEKEIDGAATGLKELNSASVSRVVVLVGEESKAVLKTSNDEELTGPKPSDDAETAEYDKGDLNEKAKPRAHFLTIREEENERLQPGEFLNDTLIDFWMQWIWRKEKHLEDSPVHFFTSHFYTALNEDGPKAVTSWTARKNIDVFTKRFIFIPVNQSLHWSLCCVVNPGAILNKVKALNEDPKDDKLYPCILFFDSLKAHRKAAIARHVRDWLNSEWRRLEKASSQNEEEPFKSSSLLVHEPRVPYQDNSWDCGVFVCRYAHAVYSMRDCDIRFGDAREGPGGRPFQQAITDSKAFDFDRDDIVRIRTELGVLIGRLSTIYKTWKDATDQAEKEAKKPAACRQLLLDDDPTVNANDGKPAVTKKQEVTVKPCTRQQLSSAGEEVRFVDAVEKMSLESDEAKSCDENFAFI